MLDFLQRKIFIFNSYFQICFPSMSILTCCCLYKSISFNWFLVKIMWILNMVCVCAFVWVLANAKYGQCLCLIWFETIISLELLLIAGLSTLVSSLEMTKPLKTTILRVVLSFIWCLHWEVAVVKWYYHRKPVEVLCYRYFYERESCVRVDKTKMWQ